MRRTRVLLADDNPAILEHVAHMLEAEFEIVGTVFDGESALREYEQTKPDILVLDISMGDLSGLDVARRILQMGHQSRIVFLTVHEEAEFVCAAFAAGGSAYVVKSRLNLDLLDALHASLADRIFVSPPLQHA